MVRDTSAVRLLMWDGIHAPELSARRRSSPFILKPVGEVVTSIAPLFGTGKMGFFAVIVRAVSNDALGTRGVRKYARMMMLVRQ